MRYASRRLFSFVFCVSNPNFFYLGKTMYSELYLLAMSLTTLVKRIIHDNNSIKDRHTNHTIPYRCELNSTILDS